MINKKTQNGLPKLKRTNYYWKGLFIDQEGTTKYMVLSRHQNGGQNHNLVLANKSCENMAKFKYLETTVTNKNCIR